MSVKVEPEFKAPVSKLERLRKMEFIREIRDELKKVTWTTREELLLSTKVVIISTFMFGIGIYFADLAIKGVLNGFGGLFRLIFG
jgi:preprotein translocase subunit SecE